MRNTIQASEGASVCLLAVCAGSVASLFLSLALSSSTAGFDGMSAYGWAGYALMQAAFIATVFIFGYVRKWDFKRVLRTVKPVNWWQLALTPLIAIATILVFLPLANLWSSFLSLIGYHGSGISMPAYSSVGAYFLSLLVMAALPAIGEELLMRGGVFSALSTRSVWFGVLISALMFSLMHANPMQTVHQFGLGVTLALTVALTGSVWCAALVHFFNNFISITVTAYIPEVDAIYVKLGYFNWLTGAASVLVGAFLLLALLFALYRLGETERKISRRVDYENYSFYFEDTSKKTNFFKEFFKFLALLFAGKAHAGQRRRVTEELTRRNGVELILSNDNLRAMGAGVSAGKLLFGVWLAIGLLGVYWLYAFISGLL